MKDHVQAALDAVPLQITGDIVDVFLGGPSSPDSQMSTTVTRATSRPAPNSNLL
jgi:hypothetical protein